MGLDVCPCAFFSKTVDVSIPDAGSTMEPEQRDVSHGLSAPDRSAAGLNASGGSGARKVKKMQLLSVFGRVLRLLLERNVE